MNATSRKSNEWLQEEKKKDRQNKGEYPLEAARLAGKPSEINRAPEKVKGVECFCYLQSRRY